MSSGLTHIGAIARGLGYAPSPSPSARGPARQPQDAVEEPPAIQPAPAGENPVQTRERLRAQLMAERGVDLFDLYRMGAQERIRTQTAIMVETTLRASRAPVRATGSLLDLRV